jgi:hypothetical protein
LAAWTGELEHVVHEAHQSLVLTPEPPPAAQRAPARSYTTEQGM